LHIEPTWKLDSVYITAVLSNSPTFFLQWFTYNNVMRPMIWFEIAHIYQNLGNIDKKNQHLNSNKLGISSVIINKIK